MKVENIAKTKLFVFISIKNKTLIFHLFASTHKTLTQFPKFKIQT